jgi:hypothetical protein
MYYYRNGDKSREKEKPPPEPPARPPDRVRATLAHARQGLELAVVALIDLASDPATPGHKACGIAAGLDLLAREVLCWAVQEEKEVRG